MTYEYRKRILDYIKHVSLKVSDPVSSAIESIAGSDLLTFLFLTGQTWLEGVVSKVPRVLLCTS